MNNVISEHLTESEENRCFMEAQGVLRRLLKSDYKNDNEEPPYKEYVVSFNENKLKLKEKPLNNNSYENEYYVILTGNVLKEYFCTKSINEALNKVFYIIAKYKYGKYTDQEKKYFPFSLIPAENYIQDAIVFAARKHDGQFRKGTCTPYIVHPMHVMYILQKMEFPVSVVVAGILHDTLEDTDTTEEEIKSNFGSKVLEYVKSMSEDKSKPWEQRKADTIDKIATDSEGVKAICFADKYSNLLSMYKDLKIYKESLWERFNASKENIEWYYRGVGDALYNTFHDYDEYEEYIQLLDKVFGAKNC